MGISTILDAVLVRASYTAFWLLDQLVGSRERLPFHEARKTFHSRLTRSNGVLTRLDRVPELRIDYLDSASLRGLGATPILFKGLAARIPAVNSWTLSSLAERYGQMEYPVHRSGAEYYRMDVLRLSEVLGKIGEGRAPHAVYGLGSPTDILSSDVRLQQELSLASWMDGRRLRRPFFRGSNLWVSGEGHWTPIHSEVGHVFSVQARGSRRWTIYAPSRSAELLPEIRGGLIMHSHLYANASRLRDESFGMRGWECVTEEGDVLFCPSYHWHFVETLRTSISASTRWVTLRSLVRHPIMTALFAKRALHQNPARRLSPLDAPYGA